MHKKIKMLLIFVVSIILLYLLTVVVVIVLDRFDLIKENNIIKKQNVNLSNNIDLKDNSKYLSPLAPNFGNKDSKISVVVFIDFDCPYCFKEYSVLRRIMTEYKDSVYFEFRNMPLETLHPNANLIANVAMCANSQGKFWEMFDQIFSNYDQRQDIYSNEDVDSLLIKEFYNYGLKIGLDMNKFSECYDNKSFDALIKKDFVNGVDFGVNSTPTFFINGNMVAGVLAYENWKEVFDLSIEKNK